MKALAARPKWRLDDGGRFRLQVPLMVDGIVVEGLFLYARCSQSEPGRDVSFMLVNSPTGESRQVIDRIDWKPLTSHLNKNSGPSELRLKLINGTHRHSLYDNLKLDGEVRSKNIPIAREVDQRLETFESLVDFVQSLYKIDGVKFVPLPLWVEDLFG